MATFTKTITAQFEQVGRKQKLVGQLGEIRDESGLLIHSQLYNTAPEAEIKLNALVRELLTDYAERGLVDTLPVEDAPVGLMSADIDPFGDPRTEDEKRASVEGWIEFTPCDGYPFGGWEKPHVHPFDDSRTVMVRKPRLFAAALTQPDHVTAHTAQRLANNTGVPTYVVMQHGHFLIQDDADLDCYGGRADVVATYQPMAVTRQSQSIEAKLTVCGYCAGIHHIQQCPTLRNAVLAPVWKGADLGRGLCQLLWRNHAGFVQLLSNATPARLVEYAESYLMFLAIRSSTNLTVREVLARWAREIGSDRGPAEMALQAAA
jgi:hypothetical protein